MIRLIYSNRVGELLAELAARVRAQQSREGPLVAVRIAVPSPSVEKYTRLGIARACGVAANLRTSLLTPWAHEVCASSRRRVADATSFEAMALALLLDDEFLAEPELSAVRSYLDACGDTPDPRDVRRVQLAARIGRLFEEYTFSRGEMLAAWRSGPVFDGRCGETERWQRRMWLAMFGEGGLAERRSVGEERRLVPLHEAVQLLDPKTDALPGGVHLFAFSHVARTFLQLFERLAASRDVVLYALSPCEGFWEDVDIHDPAPLHLWGRPGRDQVRALNAIAGFDHEDCFVDPLRGASPGTHSLLRQLQSDVLRRETPQALSDGGARFDSDDSIVVLEHTSARRELEAVASEIWRLVESDSSLHFDDIAIVVPEADAQTYAAHFRGVFREAHDLPYQTVSLPLPNASSVVEAIQLLLQLPLGRFTRSDLLRVVAHPAVAGEAGEADAERWASWCDALGIAHGADRADHEGTYIARDILNWDQGLRRLALGSFMAGDASGDRTAFELGCEAYVPHEVAAAEIHEATDFGLLLRSIVADARFARQAELTMGQWSEFFRQLVLAYVTPAGRADEELLARSLRGLHGMAAIDLGDRRVRYRVAYEVARQRLAAVASGQAGAGVVVSTLLALRPVPFRVVFACGLGEGRFPAPEVDDPLDLRWARRRAGDVTARERDRYAFLELLLSTEDRLILSYVSRDPVTGDELSSSSLVGELLHALARGYARDVNAMRRRHPLLRWDPQYFPDLFPDQRKEPGLGGAMRLSEARAEAQALALRRDLESRGTFVAPSEILSRSQDDPAWALVSKHLGLTPLGRAVPSVETRVRVPLYAITKFLEFPLQAWARFRLGLDEADDEDTAALDDESFETEPREEAMFLRKVLLDSRAAAGLPIAQVYDTAAHDRELRGSGPSGVFARGERENHLETLHAWCSEIVESGVRIDSIQVHRFGRGTQFAPADQTHDALALDVDVVDASGTARVVCVELGGGLLPLGAQGAVSLTLAKRAEQDGEWARAGRERAALRAFVDHAILSASGVSGGRSFASVSVVASGEERVTDRVRFEALSRDEATIWLRNVVRDLLSGPHAYFLPCEAVFVHRQRDPDASMARTFEEAREKLGESDGPPALRSAYGPVPRPYKYPVPDELRIREMIARRFNLFFDKRERSS
jgi:exodeoxyribonuclease V gamma subunit